jgi:hypothetical protein
MRVTVLLLIFTFNRLCGINTTDSLHTLKKWSIGISFSPDYSYRILKPLNSYSSTTTTWNKICADSLNSIEKATVSWTLGIPITFHFNKHLSVKTGMYLSNKTFQSKGFVQTNGLYLYWQIFKTNNWEKQNFFFIEIPFAIEYTYRPKKLNKTTISAWGGITTCSNITEHYYNSRRWETDNQYQHPELESSYSKLYVDKLKLLYLGYTAGLKMTYKLNEKFLIGLEPVFKYYGKEFVSADSYSMSWSPNKLSRQIMGVTEKPYSFGINLSLEFTK